MSEKLAAIQITITPIFRDTESGAEIQHGAISEKLFIAPEEWSHIARIKTEFTGRVPKWPLTDPNGEGYYDVIEGPRFNFVLEDGPHALSRG